MISAAILSIGIAEPPYRYTQDEVFDLAGYRRDSIRSVFRNSAIKSRNLALDPAHAIQNDPDFFAEHYATWSRELGVRAARQALERAKIEPRDVDYLIATSCTGYVCPGISQVIAQELGLHSRTRIVNMVGQGCSAAIPALERATEFVERHPGKVALVVSVEVSSAAYWIDDNDLETAVGNSLFSDGAAAAVVCARSKDFGVPRLESFAVRSNRELIEYMGFYNDSGRLRVKLSRKVPEAVMPLADATIHDLLGAKHLTRMDVSHWFVHPGGRKILELAGERWGFASGPKNPLSLSWDVLSDYGNMSSATVLFVLERFLSSSVSKPNRGEFGLMLAMGPGLAVEGCLLRWA